MLYNIISFMKYNNLYREYPLFLAVLTILASCTRNRASYDTVTNDIDFSTVEIDLSSDFYNVSIDKNPPEILILEEDDKTMFTDVDRIIEDNGLYFLMDSYSARTVVSFTNEGKPYARYGTVGQGPGEYTLPWDIDIHGDYVFVMDSNSKKMIKYLKDGTFVSEIKLPVLADAFKVLDNGNILLNLMPIEDKNYSLCLLDSAGKELKFMLPYPEGYEGGLHTPDVFRESNGMLTYFRAPSDTLFILNEKGVPDKAMIFDFKSNGLPDEVKLDFSKRNRDKSYLWFVNNPIYQDNGLWLGVVENGTQQYTVVFSDKNNSCGAKIFDKGSSIYDPIEPLGADSQGNLICLINFDIASYCADYSALPEEIKNKLEDGYRALLIYDE